MGAEIGWVLLAAAALTAVYLMNEARITRWRSRRKTGDAEVETELLKQHPELNTEVWDAATTFTSHLPDDIIETMDVQITSTGDVALVWDGGVTVEFTEYGHTVCLPDHRLAGTTDTLQESVSELTTTLRGEAE